MKQVVIQIGGEILEMDSHNFQHWYERYMEASMLVMRRMNEELFEEAPGKLTEEQYQILRYISKKGECTSTELADAFRVGRSSITAMITRLVNRDVLSRRRDETDRRVVYLSLTPEGRGSFASCENKVKEVVSSYLNHFEAQEAETFVATFEKLARLIGKET